MPNSFEEAAIKSIRAQNRKAVVAGWLYDWLHEAALDSALGDPTVDAIVESLTDELVATLFLLVKAGLADECA